MDGHFIVYIRNKMSQLSVPAGFFTDQDELNIFMNMNRMKVGDGYEMYYNITTPDEYEYFRRIVYGEHFISPSV